MRFETRVSAPQQSGPGAPDPQFYHYVSDSSCYSGAGGLLGPACAPVKFIFASRGAFRPVPLAAGGEGAVWPGLRACECNFGFTRCFQAGLIPQVTWALLHAFLPASWPSAPAYSVAYLYSTGLYTCTRIFCLGSPTAV